MKNIKRILLFLVIVGVFPVSSFAQSGISVRAGGNALWFGLFYLVALGDDEEMENSPEENDDRVNSGPLDFPVGLNAGLKYQFGLLKNLDMFVSADIFFRYYGDDPIMGIEDLGKDRALPSRVNYPLLLGLNYTIMERDDVALWTEFGSGISYCRFRTQRITGGTFPNNVEVNTLKHWGITPAWKVGLGVTVDEKYSLEVSCYSYDNPELYGGNSEGKGGTVKEWTSKLAEGFVSNRLKFSMISLRLALHF